MTRIHDSIKKTAANRRIMRTKSFLFAITRDREHEKKILNNTHVTKIASCFENLLAYNDWRSFKCWDVI